MGKGSTPRPFSIAQDEYANRWDAIFGRDKQKIEPEEDTSDELEEEEDDDYICPQCSGSGEGMYDGSSCSKCGGTGGYPVDREYDYDAD